MKIKPKLLCPITDWEERLTERGRGVGTKIKERMVIGADNLNWFIGTQRAGKDDMVPGAYFGSMRLLLPTLREMGLDTTKAIQFIVSALVEKTNKEPEFKGDPYENLATLGRWMDENFGTNLFKPYPPTAYYTIFKCEDEKPTENEENVLHNS